MDSSQSGTLSKACVCGHNHKTYRGEDVHMCLDCQCDEFIPRCQNCGEPTPYPSLDFPRWDVCSRRCAFQLEHAERMAA